VKLPLLKVNHPSADECNREVEKFKQQLQKSASKKSTLNIDEDLDEDGVHISDQGKINGAQKKPYP